MIRSLFWIGFYTLAAIPLAIIGFPWTFVTRKIDFLYSAATRVALAGVRLAGVRVEVIGRERINPSRTYIFMCNHASNLDPPIVVPLIPRRTSVLVKKELFRIPVLAQAMRMGSLVAVDRSNREAAIASLRAANDVLRAGVNLTVFPEGTRSPDGRLLPFKKGPFYVAMDSGAPIVPLTIIGTHEMLPKGGIRIRPGTARLVFHEPVDPGVFAGREELMQAVRERIASSLPEQYR